MPTYFKTFNVCLLLCILNLSGCNSGNSSSGSNSSEHLGSKPDFSCANSLETVVPAPEHPEARQDTGAFFQQRQKDGVSCGLASLNALHGREVVTKGSALKALWDISQTKKTASGLAWTGNQQLDSGQIEYLMHEFAPKDPTQTDKKKKTAMITVKTQAGVEMLRNIMDHSILGCTFPENFILLQSGYQASHNKGTGYFSWATGGHYVAVRQNTHDNWVVIDSANPYQQERSFEQVLPPLPEETDEKSTNNGPEYQLLFYVTEDERKTWEAQSNTLFGYGVSVST